MLRLPRPLGTHIHDGIYSGIERIHSLVELAPPLRLVVIRLLLFVASSGVDSEGILDWDLMGSVLIAESVNTLAPIFRTN